LKSNIVTESFPLNSHEVLLLYTGLVWAVYLAHRFFLHACMYELPFCAP
jgi:hypothetical protein